MDNRKERKLGFKFKYGDHAGETLKEVIIEDWAYMDYLVENMLILLDNEAYEFYENKGIENE